MRRLTGYGLGLAALAAAWMAGTIAPARAGDEPERRIEIFKSRGARLGVSLADVGPDDVTRLKLAEERGALVKDVEPGSPAEKAGLKEGDVILRWQGEAVQSAAQLARLVRETPAGRKAGIEASRGGAAQRLTATLEENRGIRFDLGELEIPEPPLPPEPLLPRHFEWRDDDGGRQLLRRVLRQPGTRKLGIEYQEISSQLARYFKLSDESGVLVSEVVEESPAAKAGIKAGDVLLKVSGRTVRDGGDLRDALEDARPGSEVTVTVQRDGKPLDLKVTLGGEPSRQRLRRTTSRDET